MSVSVSVSVSVCVCMQKPRRPACMVLNEAQKTCVHWFRSTLEASSLHFARPKTIREASFPNSQSRTFKSYITALVSRALGTSET